MEWLVEVNGSPGSLAKYAQQFNGGDSLIAHDGFTWVLRSSNLDHVTDASSAKKIAEEMLDRMTNAMALFDLDVSPLQVSGLSRTRVNGRDDLYVFPTSIVSAESFGKPSILVNGQPSPPGPKDRLPAKAVAIATENPQVEKVLRLLQAHGASWHQWYSVYEIIEQAVGGEEAFCNLAGISKTLLKRWRHSANHPQASGDNARHGHLNADPPTNPLLENEGRQIVRTAAKNWIKSMPG